MLPLRQFPSSLSLLALAAPRTFLAACEARRNSGSDWGDVEIVSRRSNDAGRTWEPARASAAGGPPG